MKRNGEQLIIIIILRKCSTHQMSWQKPSGASGPCIRIGVQSKSDVQYFMQFISHKIIEYLSCLMSHMTIYVIQVHCRYCHFRVPTKLISILMHVNASCCMYNCTLLCYSIWACKYNQISSLQSISLSNGWRAYEVMQTNALSFRVVLTTHDGAI